MSETMLSRDEISSRVEKVIDGCWEWTGPLTWHGYGEYRPAGGRRARAHRLAYEAFVGPIPDGLCVLHACDNRKCVNPQHLSVGTRKQNQEDMKAKGRAFRPIGDLCGNARLTWAQVKAMRALAAGGTSRAEIARRYGVKPATASLIVRGKRWPERSEAVSR